METPVRCKVRELRACTGRGVCTNSSLRRHTLESGSVAVTFPISHRHPRSWTQLMANNYQASSACSRLCDFITRSREKAPSLLNKGPLWHCSLKGRTAVEPRSLYTPLNNKRPVIVIDFRAFCVSAVLLVSLAAVTFLWRIAYWIVAESIDYPLICLVCKYLWNYINRFILRNILNSRCCFKRQRVWVREWESYKSEIPKELAATVTV